MGCKIHFYMLFELKCVSAVCVLVMCGWRFYLWALRMIRGSGGSGNKKIHSDYLRVEIINDANINYIF